LAGSEDEELDHGWGELDNDAARTDEATNRLAVCHMDWDRIRASDLMVLFSSFLPQGGLIHSVMVCVLFCKMHNSFHEGDQCKEDEMGRSCKVHEIDEKYTIAYKGREKFKIEALGLLEYCTIWGCCSVQMEAVHLSKRLVSTVLFLEDLDLHQHQCENHKYRTDKTDIK